jgi:putative hemolysin
MALELVRVGRYRARLASSKKDVSAAQALRYQCFNLSNEGKLDVDGFDTNFQKLFITIL